MHDLVRLTLARDDLVLLQNALNEILNGPGRIDPVEFEVRTGSTIAHARELLERLTDIP